MNDNTFFHGTDRKITEFEPSQTGRFGKGFYFFPDYQRAENWSDGFVYEVELNIKNPLILESTNTTFRMLGIAFDGGEETQNQLIERGYDGIYVYAYGELSEVVAFYKNQIKIVKEYKTK